MRGCNVRTSFGADVCGVGTPVNPVIAKSSPGYREILIFIQHLN
jgi:hypothetical protein